MHSNHSVEKTLKMKTHKTHVGINVTKRILTGLVLAVGLIFVRHDAAAGQTPVALGSATTFGTTSVFKGTILAFASITVTTGAAVEGRLLARTGAVTLDSNTVGLVITADTTPPIVSSTFPVNAATSVGIDAKIAAVFSEA